MNLRKLALGLAVGITVVCFGAGNALAQRVVLGGNPPGSLFYSMAQAIGTTVTKHSPLKVDVLPQGGSTYYPMMSTGEVDFGLVNPIDALAATKARPPYDKVSRGRGFPMQTLMLGSPIRLSLVTTKASGITSVKQLRGRRVAANYGAFASAGLTAVAVLANHGMTLKDIDVVTVSSYPEGVRAVMEGRAIAAVASIGSGIIRELDASRGAVILPIDPSPAAMARAQKIGEAYVTIKVPKGPPGVASQIFALSYAITIVVRPDLDDQTAYKFIDALWNNYKDLKGIFRPLGSWTSNRFASTEAVMPYHPGAIKFYKEKGVWNSGLVSHQAKLLRAR